MVQNNLSMKKLIASAGLVALGAISLKAQYAPGLTRTEASKPWSISASLRGFYDDNYLALPKSAADESFGFEVRPRVALNLSREQTFIGASYTYDLKWYEARDEDPIDQSHEVDLNLDHRFSERAKITLADSFVYAQEPEIADGIGSAVTTFRTGADVIRNRASIDGIVQLTELLGLGLGYQNGWYDYQDDELDGAELVGSRSDLLDRLEHLFRIDARWQARQDLVGLVGYQFGITDYTGDEPIFINPLTGFPISGITSEIRNNDSHYFYVGADYTLSEQLSFQGRAGGRYTRYTEVDENDLSPYVEISGKYSYLPGSYLTVGFRHDRNPTDVAVALDQESSVIFGSVSHRITPLLTGNLLAQYQHSVYGQGAVEDEVDNFFIAGVNLQYQITQNLAAEAGYNYDRLDSDLGFRSFTRNRLYLGVRAAY